MSLEGSYEPSTVDWVADQVARYEASGGEEGRFIHGYPCVVLTTKGAKTGAIRKSPVIRVHDGGRYAAVASLGGAPNNPNWYHNLRANPLVRLQDGAEVGDYRARLVEGDERARWWEHAVATFPQYAEYQDNTDRVIPVFVLEPVSG